LRPSSPLSTGGGLVAERIKPNPPSSQRQRLSEAFAAVEGVCRSHDGYMVMTIRQSVGLLENEPTLRRRATEILQRICSMRYGRKP